MVEIVTTFPPDALAEVTRSLEVRNFRLTTAADVEKNPGWYKNSVAFSIKTVESLRKRFGIPTPIYFGMFHTYGTQAMAMRMIQSNALCIIVGEGTFSRVWAVILNIMQTKELAKLLGLEHQPISRKEELKDSNFVSSFRFLTENLVRQPSAVGADCRPYIHVLNELAMCFLFQHEMAHIAHGHLSLKDIAPMSQIEESPQRDTTSKDRTVTLHTLEMDADASAMNFVLNLAINGVRRLPHEPANEARRDYLLRRINMAFVATYILLRDLDRKILTFENLLETTHPHAMVRMTMASALSVGHCKRYYPELDTNEVMDANIAAAIAVEAGISEVVGTSIFLQNQLVAGKLAMEDAKIGYTIGLLRRWAKLRPHLEAVKLGNHKLAPPQFPPG